MCCTMMLRIDEDRFRQILDEMFDERLKPFATKDDVKLFATKDDFKHFATKDDLKALVTKEDAKAFATKADLDERMKDVAKKDDLKEFAKKGDLDNFATKDWFELKLAKGFGQFARYFDERFARFEEGIDQRLDDFYVMIDGFVGRMDADDGERAAVQNQVDRHESWHREAAEQTGVVLSSP